jgi:diacylglycerol kinase family enzyme
MYAENEVFLKDLNTVFLLICNVKVIGGGMMISPLSMMNDGEMEAVYFPNKVKAMALAK